MIEILGKKYPEQLSFKHGAIKLDKSRGWITLFLIVSTLTTFTILSLISLGYFLYALPIFVGLQIIITLFSLATSRSDFLKQPGMRLIGYSPEGHFVGSEKEQEIYNYVVELCYKMGIKPSMVMIQETEHVNAYAIGPTKNRSMIIITEGAIKKLTHQSLLTLISHEVAHIVNNDMRNQTLFDCFLSATATLIGLPFKLLIWFAGDDEEYSIASYILNILYSIIVDIVILGITRLILLAYSRHREFRADLGAAKINGKDAAIQMLNEMSRMEQEEVEQMPLNATFAFSGILSSFELFSTHPTWEKRINYIKNNL